MSKRRSRQKSQPTVAAEKPQPQAPVKGRRHQLPIVAAGLLAAGVAILALWLWARPTVQEPPAVDLTGAEPAVVRAIDAARADVRQAPRSAAAWGKYGMLLAGCRFRAEAMFCFLQAEQLDPREPRWPYLYATYALLDLPEDMALPKLRRAAELCGGEPDAPALRLAEVLLSQGQGDEAGQVYRQLLARRPEHPKALLGLARVAYERGDLQDGLASLQRCVSDPATHKAANRLLAELRQRLGDRAGAEQAQRLAAAAPDDRPWPDPFLDEIQLYRVGKEGSLARTNHLQGAGRTQEAQAMYQRARQEYPELRLLEDGQALLGRKQYAAAEKALREAARLAPESFEAHFYLGLSLQRQKNYAEAVTSFRRVTELDPTYAPAHYCLGECLRAQGDTEAALDALRQAVRYQPDFAEAHRTLGELLAKKGQKKEAVIHLRHALEQNPEDKAARQILDQINPH